MRIVRQYRMPAQTQEKEMKCKIIPPDVYRAELFFTFAAAMTGLFIILLFWLAGNALSTLTGGYVSGNIIGMILLFAALCLRWVRAETVRPAARFLLGAMALFFVPYGVGLMDSYLVILDNLWAIVISGIVSTLIVLLVTGRTFQSLDRRSRLRHIKHLRGDD